LKDDHQTKQRKATPWANGTKQPNASLGSLSPVEAGPNNKWNE